MDGNEVTERVTQANRKGRIRWYDETMPAVWRKFQYDMREMLLDKCWEGELDNFCARWFSMSEARMRAIVFDSPKEEPEFVAVRTPEEVEHVVREILYPVVEKKAASEERARRAMSPAEKQRAYRERRRVGAK